MSLRPPLRIVYLFEDTPLFGGVKIVLRQANLMTRRGHDVKVVSAGGPLDWFPLEAELVRTEGLGPEQIPPADVTIATYWTTIRYAIDGASAEVGHYCQGFEATYTHNEAEHPAILAAYAQPIPALALSPHLGRMVHERFGRPVRVVPQALGPGWRPRAAEQPASSPRILVTSPWEIDWKGVPTALDALRRLRASGLDCQVIRLSQWPQPAAERALLDADEFHEHVAPDDVPALVRGCDLQLAASWEQEGFGMPVLEAMASGVPVVCSDISTFRDFASPAAELVPYDDPVALATAIRRVLGDHDRWRAMRAAGLEIAAKFAEKPIAEKAEDALYWIASGAWRAER